MIVWINQQEVKKKLEHNIKENSNLYTFNGIMFVVLGMIALFVPWIAAEFIDIAVGILLIVTGIFHVGVSFATKRYWAYYLSAFICLVTGGLMLLQPKAGIMAITLIVTMFMLLQGCMQLFYAALYAPFPGWSWMFTSGSISILLAVIVFAGWPVSAAWFLGVLVGVNLIMIGLSMIMLTKKINRA